MSPFIAELLGTMILILMGNGVVANVVLNKTLGKDSGWIVITTGWAFAVYLGVVIAGPSSGAHLNPAVTLALAFKGAFEWANVGSYIAAQFIGAMIGASLVWLTYKPHFDATETSTLGCFSTGPAIPNFTFNMISEVVGTFVLVFCILHLAGPELVCGETTAKVGLGSVGAIPVAFLIWGLGLSLGGTTGYALNPARDLGPRIMHAILVGKDSNWGYAAIPVIAPIIGGILAVIVFNAVR